VVTGELLQRGRAGGAEPGDLGHETGPALLGRAVAGHPEIEMEPVLGGLRLGNLEQAQARRDATPVGSCSHAASIPSSNSPSNCASHSARVANGGGGRFVDVSGSGLPEHSHQLWVRTVQGEIDTGRHLPTRGRGDDSQGMAAAMDGRSLMEVMFERVAGIDVGKASLTVCVRTPGARRGQHSETRTFKTTTGSLRVMRDWLVEHQVTIAAMESTSTYWKAPFYCLEDVMQVWLLNAAHMKAVPGRKTDVRDAKWIAQLLECGLLQPSMVPPPPIRQLRMLTRYRVPLMGDRTREAIRLEMMLEDASIKLSSVASSLTTLSARVMLQAMIEGERDPLVLAEMAKGRMGRKIPDLAQALDGHFDEHHARMAKTILGRLDMVEESLTELDEVIAAKCAPWAHQIELLQTIPGVGEKVAQVIVAETGADMSRFPSAAHLAAWAGVAPAIYESAGKRTPSGKRHGNKWLTAMLVEAAGSLGLAMD